MGKLALTALPAALRCGSIASRARNRPHDLARSLEDRVDAHVAHEPLDRIRVLTAPFQRVRGLVASAAQDLLRLVGRCPTPPRCRTSWPWPPRRGCRSSCGRPAPTSGRSSPRRRIVSTDMPCAILSAIGAVLADRSRPTARARWPTRLAMSTQARMAPTQFAGSVSRPVFRVVNATRSPLPSPAMMFSRGTLTSLNSTTAVVQRLRDP